MISEWGNPAVRKAVIPQGKQTRGIETSKYPEEKKSTEIPSVAASESGTAQTRVYVIASGRCSVGVVGADWDRLNDPGELQSLHLAEGVWKVPPKRVKAP